MKRTSFVAAACLAAFALLSCGGGGGGSGTPADAPDTNPPSEITLTGMMATDASVTFYWTDLDDADLDRAEIVCAGGASSWSSTVDAGTLAFTQEGLSANTIYEFSVRNADTSGNLSEAHRFCARTTSSGVVIYTVIGSSSGLDLIRNDPAGGYLLGGDVYCSASSSWTPIGTSAAPFTGVLLGNGYAIHDLTIDGTSSHQGLFGYISGGVVDDLMIEDASVAGASYVGALAGSCADDGYIHNCRATGSVSGSGSCAGGLVGYNDATLSSCYSAASVSSYQYAGGLVGYDEGTIQDCYSTGSVTGNMAIGGLVGYCASTTLIDSYATGAVSGSGDVGGLVGYRPPLSGTVTGCFFDSETSGTTHSDGGTAATTSAMKTQTTFAGWDFSGETANGTDDVWSISSSINGGYPYLTAIAP